jgi:glycerophosphoryl diester phosphodiesterase
MKKRAWPKLVLSLCLSMLGAYGAAVAHDWTENRAVAHALGGIQGLTYTNSRDALEFNYQRGHKVFEVDLQLTSDGVMVARHDWSKALAELLEQEYDPTTPVQSYASFAEQKIYRKFAPISLEGIAQYMATHDDMWLVTDTKSTSVKDATTDFKTLVRTYKDVAPAALERVVPQIYNRAMLAVVQEQYPFKSIIYTLYQSANSDEEVLRFCVGNNINVVTMPPGRLTPEFSRKLREAGIRIYIHTINETADAKQLLERGAHGVYTDFLLPHEVAR